MIIVPSGGGTPTAAEIGAATEAQLNNHVGDTSNPHAVTAAQVGAATTGDLQSHVGATNNPHGVTVAQTGLSVSTSSATAGGALTLQGNTLYFQPAVTPNNGQLTITGTGKLGGSGVFSANSSSNVSISITHDTQSVSTSTNYSPTTVITAVGYDSTGHINSLTSTDVANLTGDAVVVVYSSYALYQAYSNNEGGFYFYDGSLYLINQSAPSLEVDGYTFSGYEIGGGGITVVSSANDLHSAYLNGNYGTYYFDKALYIINASAPNISISGYTIPSYKIGGDIFTVATSDYDIYQDYSDFKYGPYLYGGTLYITDPNAGSIQIGNYTINGYKIGGSTSILIRPGGSASFLSNIQTTQDFNTALQSVEGSTSYYRNSFSGANAIRIIEKIVEQSGQLYQNIYSNTSAEYTNYGNIPGIFNGLMNMGPSAQPSVMWNIVFDSGEQGINSFSANNNPNFSIYGNVIMGHETCRYGSFDSPGFSRNIIIGYEAAASSSWESANEVSSNIYLGANSGQSCGGSNNFSGNIFLGSEAGSYVSVTDLSSSIFIGSSAGRFGSYGDNVVCIGNNATVNADYEFQLGGSSHTVYTYQAIQTRSDARDKTAVRDTQVGLDFLKQLRPVDFKWDFRSDYWYEEEYEEDVLDAEGNLTETIKKKRLVKGDKDGSKARNRYHCGFIAQEVQSTLKENNIDYAMLHDASVRGGEDVLTIAYSELIGPLVKAVQELSARIEQLEQANS